MPSDTSVSTGFCGTVRTMTGTPSSASWIILDQLEALDPALEERVDEDDVGPELPDRGDRPRAVGQHVEELDPGLCVQQIADVLGDLWHILDDEQARLITLWPSAGRYHEATNGRPTRWSGSTR